MRLIYSVRSDADVLYAAELRHSGPDVVFVYTRVAPAGWPRQPGRVDAALLAEFGWPPDQEPTCYVCGPTVFVEAMADLLVDAGHPPVRVRTERFG
jgi:ferredoxin-NADP reductase